MDSSFLSANKQKRGFTALAGCAGPDCQAEVGLVLHEGVQEQCVRKSLRVFLSKAAIKINVGVFLTSHALSLIWKHFEVVLLKGNECVRVELLWNQ